MLKIIEIIKAHKAKTYTLADQAILSGVSFLLTIIITRSLGLQQVGIYTLVWLVVLFTISLNQATIISPLLIFGSKKKEGQNIQLYFKGTFQLQILFATTLGICSGIFMLFYKNFYPGIQLNNIALKVGIIVLLNLTNDFFRKYFYLTSKHHKALLFDILGYGLLVTLLALSIINNTFTLDKLFTYIALSHGTATLYGVSQFHLISFDSSHIVKVVKMHLSFSSWLILAAVFQWFAGNIFLIVAAKTLSIEALGAIRIMQNLVGLLNVLFISIENYVPISAAKIFEESGYKALIAYLKQTISKAGIFFCLLLVSMILLSKQIIQLTYGIQYINYSYLLSAFILLYFFVFISMNLRIGLRAMEVTRPIFISYAIVALFSLLVAKPLIQHTGDIGVVIGLTMCQIIMTIYYSWRTHRENPKYKPLAQ